MSREQWRYRRGGRSVWNHAAIASELARLDALGLDPYRDLCSLLEIDDRGKKALLGELVTLGYTLPPVASRRGAPRLVCDCGWSCDVDAMATLVEHCGFAHDREPSRLERTPRHLAG